MPILIEIQINSYCTVCTYVSVGSLLYSCVSKIWSKCEIYNLFVDKIVKFEFSKKKKTSQSDMEFVKYFTPVSFPKFSILPKKRVHCDIFGKT